MASRFTHSIIKQVITIILITTICMPLSGQTMGNGTFTVPRTVKDATILPSPEVASLITRSKTTISYSTGTASISVPLMNWHVGNYLMSLGINATVSAIKKDEMPGFIGLGWTLSGGGFVSREIRGRPDEEFGVSLPENNNVSLAFLANLAHGQADSEYDRYHYNFAGYSGTFIVKYGQIIQLPQTDLKVERINIESNGISDWKITTPDGAVYQFTNREIIQYQFNPNVVDELYRDPSYTAVNTWQLTTITTPDRSDIITFHYDDVPTWSRSENNETASLGYSWGQFSSGEESSPQSGMRAQSVTTFIGQKLISRITSRTGIAIFNSAPRTNENNTFGGNRRISSVILLNANGTEVRRVEFENSLCHNNGKTRLDALRIKSGETLLDSRTFQYHSTRALTASDFNGQDFFGYSNHNQQNLRTDDSVLDKYGRLSSNRGYDFQSALSCAILGFNCASGEQVTIEYEPSQINSSGREINIGVRIKKIIERNGNGEKLIRDLAYDSGQASCNIEFSNISENDFISLSGVRRRLNLQTGTTYSIGASMTASSRKPGFAIENASIYYGKVSELVSGTGIEQSEKTEYFYDLQNLKHQFVAAGISSLPVISTGVVNSIAGRYLGAFNTFVANGDSLQQAYQRVLASPHLINGYYRETLWDKAPLKKIIQYRWNESNCCYEKSSETSNYYSIDKTSPQIVAFFSESLVRKIQGTHLTEDFQSTQDFNYFPISVVSGRQFCDSTTTITFFERGKTHREITRYTYGSRPDLQVIEPVSPIRPLIDIDFPIYNISLAGFPEDSISKSNYGLLLSAVTESGSRTFGKYYAYSSSLNGGVWDNANTYGYVALPAIDRFIVSEKHGTTIKSDTITVTRNYSAISANSGPRLLNEKILSHKNGELDELSREEITNYSSYGHPTHIAINHQEPMLYGWGEDGDCLISAQRNGTNRITTFRHAPLVGCTQITTPSGKSSYFEYNATRLSSILNNDGEQVKQVEYQLKELDGENSITIATFVAQPNQSSDHCNAPQKKTEKNYYDGWGRIIGQMKIDAGLNGIGSISDYSEYDALGRILKKWANTPIGNESALTASEINSSSTAFYGDNKAYEQYEYEKGGEGRIIAKYQAGSQFADVPLTTDYLCNDNSIAQLSCRKYMATSDFTLKYVGSFENGELLVTRTTDADGRVQLIFSDFKGDKILERQVTSNGFVDTYFVNNCFGNPLFILQPKASAALNAINSQWDIRDDAILREFAFYYRYDNRYLLVEKKLPGQEPTLFINDLSGNAIFTQNADHRNRNVWAFQIEDNDNRKAISGECVISNISQTTSAIKQIVVIATPVAQGIGVDGGSYTVNFPLIQANVFVENIYDENSFTGLLTTKRVRILGNHSLTFGEASSSSAPNEWVVQSFTYDNEERIENIHKANHLGGTDHIQYIYNLDGSIASTMETIGATTVNEQQLLQLSNSYGGAGQLSSIWASGNALPAELQNGVILQENGYDAINRLNRRTQATFSLDERALRNQVETFSFDTQHRVISHNFNGGLATNLANDYRTLTENISYDHLGNMSCYQLITHLPEHSHSLNLQYEYDELNRLTRVGDNTSGADLTQFDYDMNGNITTLQRHDVACDNTTGEISIGALIDDVTFTYSGNKLVTITDNALAFDHYGFHQLNTQNGESQLEYDTSGRIIRDGSRNISYVSYNEVNRPQLIVTLMGDSVSFFYDAEGNKLRMVEKRASALNTATLPTTEVLSPVAERIVNVWDYVDTRVYLNNQLIHQQLPRGVIKWNSTGDAMLLASVSDYHGNTMFVTDGANQNQFSAYYPYGMRLSISDNPDLYNYLFEGKEYIISAGLHDYDISARFYHAPVARWQNPDELAEKTPSITPYAFCQNNPITYADLDGKAIETAWDIANVAMDVASLTANVATGNVGGAIVDGLSLVGDAAATAIPFVPGGFGAAVKAYRMTAKTNALAKTVQKSKTIFKVGKSLANIRRSAVRKAWRQEKRLVEKTGKGTRNWTIAEKEELLQRGSVRNYQGHHINNVKDHPDLAGDPDNIMFVNKKEHIEQHKGNFKNESHGDRIDREKTIEHGEKGKKLHIYKYR